MDNMDGYAWGDKFRDGISQTLMPIERHLVADNCTPEHSLGRSLRE